MKKDQFQDKYDEVFQNLKEEKMDWDFEDFMKETQMQTNDNEPSLKSSSPKTFFSSKIIWIAASTILIAGLFLATQLWNTNSSKIEQNEMIVKSELEKQKNEIFQSTSIAAVEDTLQNVKSFTEDTITHEVSNPDEVINKMVPKRGRLKKVNSERFTQNNSSGTSENHVPEYHDNYVIINGHKIKNEEEAINITKYSFQMLSDNVAKTIATSVIQEMPDNE